MTAQPDVLILAHHGLLLAIPAIAPAFIVAGVISYIAIKDRRRGDDPHTQQAELTNEDGRS